MFSKIKTSVSNHPLRYFFAVLGTGIIAGIATALFGYYFFQCRLNRTVNRELTEELVSTRTEIERIRTELAASRDKISGIGSAITECRELVDSSYSEIETIRGAVEQIRNQAEILQDFYNRVSSIYYSTDNNNDNTGE